MILWQRKGRLWLSRPEWLFGLGLKHIPAVPFDLSEILTSGPKLLDRFIQTRSARDELTNRYTVGGVTATSNEFMFGRDLFAQLERVLTELLAAVNGSPWRLGRRFKHVFAEPEDDTPEPT